jgi:hypothetical protein
MSSRHTAPFSIHAEAHARRLVRWTFERGDRAITCQVDARNGAYHVRVLPHWDIADLRVSCEPTPWQALRRHAEIAARLREAGWCVTRHSG